MVDSNNLPVLIEYVVLLKNREDLESFYNDMETEGGDLYIPNRAVTCNNRRSISRNTHYMLTKEEAIQLKNDSRVQAVERADILSSGIRPLYTQTGNFNKSSIDNATHLNWGLIRCTEETSSGGWGNDADQNRTATLNFSLTGKNVDVIIIDGHIDPAHPELQTNSDGSGGSRVNQINWHSYTNQADVIDNDNANLLTGNYVYPPYIDPTYPDNDNNGVSDRTDDNNHGVHVAGTVCGSTQGWARSANIYNINPYDSRPNGAISSLIMWDYIRAFHAAKSINPVTGVKNPTVCNGSYGQAFDFPANYGTFTTGPITYINYRGTEIGTPSSTIALSDAQIESAGIRVVSGVATLPYYNIFVQADIQDAIADGIHVVGAAGNEYSKIDIPGGQDYTNLCYAKIDTLTYQWDYHQGTTPSAVPGVVCVGAVDYLRTEQKATFSNCGPRIDVYAPGRGIQSSLHTGGVADSRNASYRLGKYNGTSMASPQVCGYLTCLLEAYPLMTPAQARSHIISIAFKNLLNDSPPSNQSNTLSLQGSPNRYLYAKDIRNYSGQTYPTNLYFLRSASGQVYPRKKIKFK